MDAVGLVVNVGTDRIATLALASILTHSDLPVLLIDCGTDQPTRERFARTLDRWPGRVTIRREPVMVHGVLLDKVVPSLDTDVVVCVDSDAEILTDTVIPATLQAFAHQRVFGAGYTNGPNWLGPLDNVKPGVAYYQKRPWMPFSAFRLSHAREALAAGATFAATTWWNDIPASQTISRQLAKRFQDGLSPAANQLWKLRPLRGHFGWTFPQLAKYRRDFDGNRPNYVYYDTGADLYHQCLNTGLTFDGPDHSHATNDIRHIQGVTRHALTGQAINGTAYHDIATDIEARLATYGL